MSARCMAAFALVIASSSCAPWYHDAERRAQRADDRSRIDEIAAEAKEHLDAGRHEKAARRYEEAIELNPDVAELYLGLARAKYAASKYESARAFARFGLQRHARESATEQQLRDLIVDTCAAEKLFALCLDQVEDDITTLSKVPTLYVEFVKLADAARVAALGKEHEAEALALYEDWRRTYGVPDHPRLRAWSDKILGALPGRGHADVADGDRAAAAGDHAAALDAYAAAYRVQAIPREKLVEEARRAGDAAPMPASALAEAERAGGLARDGHVGEAIAGYRRAVDAAPWVAELRYNLALLLGEVGLREDAALQMDWFTDLAPGSPAAATARSRREEWAKPAQDPAKSDASTGGNTLRTFSAVVITLGAVGASAGLAFAVVATKLNDDSRKSCDGNACDADGLSSRNNARDFGDLATTTLIASAGVFVAGLMIWALSPSPKTSVTVGVRGPGLAVTGKW